MPQSRERKKEYMRGFMADKRAGERQKRREEGLTDRYVSPPISVSPPRNFFPHTQSNQLTPIDGDVARQIAELRGQVAAIRDKLNQVIAVLSLPKRLQDAEEEQRGLYDQEEPYHTISENR